MHFLWLLNISDFFIFIAWKEMQAVGLFDFFLYLYSVTSI